MNEPFFDYLHNNKRTVSNQLFGFESGEKNYERLEYISLPKLPEATPAFDKVLAGRRTVKKFSKVPISFKDLSSLLALSLSKNSENSGEKKYSFPSGGGLYPLETYLCVSNVENLEEGIYHYSSDRHAVTRVGEYPVKSSEDFAALHLSDDLTLPPLVIYMTLVKSRFISKYGTLGYKLGLIEAGHRGQNICLAASAVGLGTCPLGNGDFAKLHSMLGVDGVNEHHIYTVAIGDGTRS